LGKPSKNNIFHKWSNDKRWERAAFVADKLIDHVTDLIHINASNDWVVYGPLAKQIPLSFAANTFNRFRHAVHHYELIRLTAIWDKAREDRVSFPTLLELLSFPEAERLLKCGVFIHWAGCGTSEDEEPTNRLRRMILKRAKEKMAAAPDEMKKLTKECKEIIASNELKALLSFRDQYIAHNLDFSNREDADQLKPKNKDETDLLEKSIPIASGFQQLLNGSDFGFNISREHAKKNAEELWGKVDFNIIDRSKKPIKDGG
jgi:hypothetical protein